jgi:hypothetical protein
VAQSYQPAPDSKDSEYPPLVVPFPEYIGKYIQKLDSHGCGFGTYRIYDAPPNVSEKQTRLFYRLGQRVSTWIRNMRVSYNGGDVMPPNEKS